MYGSENKSLESAFTHHPPCGRQIEAYKLIRDTAKQLAYLMTDRCPESPELSTAIRKLRESVMWANASIACSDD